MFSAMLMRLLPLLDFTLWGSDWGEYFHLTDRLVQEGYHPDENLGWGRAYVDFPGLFDLTGAVALVAGVSTSAAMILIVPCATAISCLLVACIVLRLGGSPVAALISAGIIALIFPEVFTNSHPVPGPIGSVLVMGFMIVFIMGDTWRRDEDVDAERPMTLYVLIVLLLFILTITHHLSLFFVIIILGLSYLLRSALVRGVEAERAFWGLWCVIAALALATVYWLLVADTFREKVMVDLAGIPGPYMMGLAWVGLVVMVLLGHYLSSRDKELPNYPFWGPSKVLPALLAFVIVAFTIIAMVALYGFPGTEIQPNEEMFLYVIPTVAMFAFMIGSTDVALRRSGGHVIIGWMFALVFSFLVSSAFESSILVPYRHVPYIVEASAVLIGIGAIHLIALGTPKGIDGPRSGPTGGPSLGRARNALFIVVALVLVMALAATAYPPKTVMGNFQEGTTESETGATLWLKGGLPGPGADPQDTSAGCVVSDHRLSSIAFGIGGQMATWDKGGPLLHGGRDEATWDVVDAIETPHGTRRVTAVLLSDDLRTGAALSQFGNPLPVEGEAWDKFFGPPFVRVYDGGDVQVLYVVRPLDTSG